MGDRAELHALIDELPEEEVPRAKRALGPFSSNFVAVPVVSRGFGVLSFADLIWARMNRLVAKYQPLTRLNYRNLDGHFAWSIQGRSPSR